MYSSESWQTCIIMQPAQSSKKSMLPLSSKSPSWPFVVQLYHHSQATINLFSVLHRFASSRMSHKWNHKTHSCLLAWLLSVSMPEIHLTRVSTIHALLLLSSIPLYGCTIVYPFVEVHLGCFQFLEVKNKVAMKISEQVLVRTCFYFSWVNN